MVTGCKTGIGAADKTDKTDRTPRHAPTPRGFVGFVGFVGRGTTCFTGTPPPRLKSRNHALRQKPEIFPYGQAFGGRPKTWTGRVVSLEEWRGLSEWERHGPGGRLFCGICRVWIAAGGNACGVAGCPIGGDA